MVIALCPTLDYRRLLMTTRLLAGVALTAVLGGTLGACAPMSGNVPDGAAVTSDESDLGASQRSYVTLRRDFRECAGMGGADGVSVAVAGGGGGDRVGTGGGVFPADRCDFVGGDTDRVRCAGDRSGGQLVAVRSFFSARTMKYEMCVDQWSLEAWNESL